MNRYIAKTDCLTRKKVYIGYFIAEDNYWACGMNNNVIAWMNLPEAPKGEDE